MTRNVDARFPLLMIASLLVILLAIPALASQQVEDLIGAGHLTFDRDSLVFQKMESGKVGVTVILRHGKNGDGTEDLAKRLQFTFNIACLPRILAGTVAPEDVIFPCWPEYKSLYREILEYCRQNRVILRECLPLADQKN